MHVLAFRHVPFEGLGHIQPVLESRGVSVHCVDLYREGQPVPDPAAAAGLIFMGGPMSVNDGLPYLEREIAILRQALERGQPVLGVCLGAQLLARAAGARVYANPRKEIGWYQVYRTPAGTADPLIGELDASQTVFHWHGETFDLPPAAEWLAWSEACRHQAFRLGSSAYGLQFHLEVTPAMIADWQQQDANCGDVRELDGPLETQRGAVQLADCAHRVFGRWSALLETATPGIDLTKVVPRTGQPGP
jgi:GMP synthase-like glutamine amidotransferase